MNKDIKIYIAGHRGLIGSAIYSECHSRGYRNLIVKDHRELDLTDSHAVETFFENNRPDYVFLAAGKVGGIIQNQETPADFLTENLKIQLNVIESAQKFSVKKLILFGSSCMYPRECLQAMSEDMLLTAKPEPTSLPYATAKLAGLQLCDAFNRQYGTQFISVIPNSVFGPFDNFDPKSGHVLSALIRRIHEAKQQQLPYVELWGTGSPRREFVFSSDVAKAVLTIMASDTEQLEVPLNISSGDEYSIKELSEMIQATVGYDGEIRWDTSKPDGAPRKLLDSTRLRKLGWQPETSFLDGLKETYRWYKESYSDASD
ncbi:GDP-L-fucose synthase family protein [Vibrio spartinae]|uniref:GDP-L-fucose synthase n=1 Tax=Vibrio spartinae TaxID=1918945 RepID=A0A1N6M2N4_9VIBR|nr:GDP-L-fucose synthase [Vibrio spartinae]QMV12996.1 GDP-L-fucose synthase [Vibrio spartinae]SIO93698.1 GDP-L-fucose synthase [Vibrio spartinae]